MNNKEYIDKICYKCENKLNDKDLCNIRQTINGDYKCINEKLSLKMLNYKEENKKLIENGRYRYYDFTEEIINNIINKKINDVTNDEWRTLIQMLYPKNMIGSGLFQSILVFEIDKDGKRKDPPVEAYNSINDLKRNLTKADCLLFRMMDYIEKNSNLKINDSWYKEKEKILREE